MPCSISGVIVRWGRVPGAAPGSAAGAWVGAGASTLARGRDPGVGIGALVSGVVLRARPEPIAMPNASSAMAAVVMAAG